MSDSRVIALLARWEERRDAGEFLTPEELCRNCPELLDEVRRSLSLLGHVDPRPKAEGTVTPQTEQATMPPGRGHSAENVRAADRCRRSLGEG